MAKAADFTPTPCATWVTTETGVAARSGKQAGVDAIKFGLTVDDLANTWAPYLTISEGLKLAAQFKGDVKKLSCCAA